MADFTRRGFLGLFGAGVAAGAAAVVRTSEAAELVVPEEWTKDWRQDVELPEQEFENPYTDVPAPDHRGFQLVASIPNDVVRELAKNGINVYRDEDLAALADWLDSAEGKIFKKVRTRLAGRIGTPQVRT